MPRILLGHGSGGRLTKDLIENLILPKLKNPILAQLTDAAYLKHKNIRFTFTTDSYVIKPINFNGGDIGKLAVYGTVNDLAVMGSKPLYISCGLIIEEGLDIDALKAVINSIASASKEAKVKVVCGDLKVVEKGNADQIYINTAGIGIVEDKVHFSRYNIKTGDKVLISGTIGDHETAVLASRKDLNIACRIQSDCAPLNSLTAAMLKVTKKIRFMRDPTRGGVGTVLNEITEDMNFGILLDEDKIPKNKKVLSICELLGFDPLYMASEGRLIAVVAQEAAQKLVTAMRRHKLARHAGIIGEVVKEPKGKVYLKTCAGGTRIIDMPTAQQLPRIC